MYVSSETPPVVPELLCVRCVRVCFYSNCIMQPTWIPAGKSSYYITLLLCIIYYICSIVSGSCQKLKGMGVGVWVAAYIPAP